MSAFAVYEEEEDPSNKSFFSEIISSVSDVKFSEDGRYILSRDYLTLRIWDINMDSKPLKTINVHDHLRPKLCDLYENDCIFDKFECTWSGDGEYVIPSVDLWAFAEDILGQSCPAHTTIISTSMTKMRRQTSCCKLTNRLSRPRRWEHRRTRVERMQRERRKQTVFAHLSTPILSTLIRKSCTLAGIQGKIQSQ